MTLFSYRSRAACLGILLLCMVFPMDPVYGQEVFSQTGTASWYGPWHHGKATAAGEQFDMFAMTAAHKSIPLGTLVRVQHKNNGKSVIVRINDRGPYLRNRIIDLSYAAADSLGITGVSQVTVEVVGDRNGRPLDSTQSFFVKLKDGPLSAASVEQQLDRLIRLGVYDAVSLLHVRDGLMALGPFSSFDESQNALVRVATTHPGASIMLAAKASMSPAIMFTAQR
ncbi:septal ring lytic transglycosylase RlpA family protein [uncultured Mailhella sp.]|uniref:septal ring lytic transglycosylase RlpA family protein n=1 Tax=uncultured Mailhella sp. TaxID=1981031 RepID=UPI002618E84E|nr:septal ring lytic transglycosylase RlpA family protein [uncultured Mailhella sp.]